MSILKEFREFAVRGNVIDLAVGVIVGAGFGRIVDSVVGDLIMPLIGRATGGLDFSQMFLPLAPIPAGTVPTLAAVKAAGVPVLAWGNFITVAVNFIILAFIIFMMVRLINRLKSSTAQAEAPAAPPVTPEDVLLLREIRDALARPRSASHSPDTP